MKKTALFLLISIVFALTGYSQKFFVGGTFSFGTKGEKIKSNNVSADGNKYFYFSFMPKAGYFISDKLAIGGTIGFYNDVETEPDDDKTKNSIMYLGPLVRYYYKPLDNAGIFIEGSAIFGFGSEKFENVEGNTTVTTKTDQGGFNIGITPGVFVNITNNIALEFNVGWIGLKNYYTKSGDIKNITNNFDFTINSVLEVGLTVNF